MQLTNYSHSRNPLYFVLQSLPNIILSYRETMHKLIKTICLLQILIVIGLNVDSAIAETSPDNIPNTTKVNAEQLIELANSYPELVIIDSRISGDRKKGYIEGSISLPNTITDCVSLNKHINKKSIPTIYYCNGTKCGRSVKAIKIAQTCGYNNIYWFRGGFEEWLSKDLPYIKK